MDKKDNAKKTNNINNPSLDETVEMLDFDLDNKVSEEIDEILDFTTEFEDVSDNNKMDDLLNNVKSSNQVEISVDKEKLDEYKPSIKNFNIKSAKTHKIVKKVMIYTVILMLLGFEFFITKAGNILNSIRVYASDNIPIRIVQNERYGYIDYTGNRLVNPKYLYAENYHDSYAIVKNSSNLPLIIDKGGKEAVDTGTYFSLYRAENDIIASKKTKNGLKYGIIDVNLKEKTPFIYDSISYKNKVYSYVKDNTVGLINLDGKDIYNYKLTDKDEKVIDVDVCNVTDNNVQRYAVVKVNSSSQIVNIDNGKRISSYTLNKILPDENNVFHEVYKNNSKTYFYVQDDKVLLESESYNNIFIYKEHDYKKNNNMYNLVKNGKVYKNVSGEYEIYKPFKNNFAVIKYSDDTYGYLTSNGELLTEEHFLEASEFDSYGDAIVKTKEGYGVINKNGKLIIKAEYDNIKMASGNVKIKSASDRNNIFYAVKVSDKYYLYNKKGKKVMKDTFYDVEFNNEYPIVKVSNELEDKLITSKKLESIKLTSYNTKYKSFENYIIVKNEYYNYSGKMIYTDNSKKGDDVNE